MTQRANVRIVLLFEDELRAAARGLHKVHAQAKSSAIDRDDCLAALEACFAALYDLGGEGDDDSLVVLSKARLLAVAQAEPDSDQKTTTEDS